VSEGFISYGEPVDPSIFEHRSRELLDAIEQNPHFSFIEARRHEESDVLVVDARVGVPSKSERGVLKVERLAIEVDGEHAPRVHALRTNFPLTPHQNLVDADAPRQLCLSESPWAEDRSTVTPARLLGKVTEWLERAAAERLYAPGQPLEPFMFSHSPLIVPAGVSLAQPGDVVVVAGGATNEILKAQVVTPDADVPEKLKWVVMPVETDMTDTLVVHSVPRDFAHLAEMLCPFGVELIALTQERTRQFALQKKQVLFDANWLFLIRVPREAPDGAGTVVETVALLLSEVTIGELGEALGVLVAGNGMRQFDMSTMLASPIIGDLAAGKVLPLNPTMTLTRERAVAMSGLDPDTQWSVPVVAVGVGALGSAVVLGLARQGIGTWTIIDPDTLMPHNLVRHALPGFAQGHSKAVGVAQVALGIIPEPDSFKACVEDVLSVGSDSDTAARIRDAMYILDFTTSRAALRRLAVSDGPAVRIAAYVTASKRHLVVMSEDRLRSTRLDDLDVMFATACAIQEGFEDVLAANDERAVRYAGGCSDVTTVLAADVIDLFAGVVTSRVKALIAEPASSLRVWALDASGPTVACSQVVVSAVDVIDTPVGWSIRVSSDVVDQMLARRSDRLPNETGGVLIGAFDVHERIVYVTGMLPSPPDSEEWPGSYVRGSRGLYAQVRAIEERSGGEVTYVGEWHSHPSGCCSMLSAVDISALDDLSAAMRNEGLPGMVLIVSDDGFHLGLVV
jgi:proteasome lid subunit RPN8/RPN11